MILIPGIGYVSDIPTEGSLIPGGGHVYTEESGVSYNDSLTESVSASDSTSCVLISSLSITETIEATETNAVTQNSIASIDESTVSNDSVSVDLTLGASIVETAEATSTLTAVFVTSAELLEPANPQDSTSATKFGGDVEENSGGSGSLYMPYGPEYVTVTVKYKEQVWKDSKEIKLLDTILKTKVEAKYVGKLDEQIILEVKQLNIVACTI